MVVTFEGGHTESIQRPSLAALGACEEGQAFGDGFILKVSRLGGEGISDQRQLRKERRDPGLGLGLRHGRGGAALVFD